MIQCCPGYLPVPVRVEICGLPGALSLTDKVPVAAPVCVGVKTTLNVHLDLAARLDEQVVVETLKGPVVEALMPVKDTVPRLSSVNVFAALDVPTAVFGKFADAGVSLAATPPVPERATVCGLPGALSVIVKVPVRVPEAVGVKVTSILQFFPAASVLPQGFVLAVKAKSPLVAMLLMFSVALPELVRTTDFVVPVEPTATVPQVSEVVDKVTLGPALELTVKVRVVVWVTLPATPVIVSVDVPVVAVPLAVSVSVLVVVVELGLNAAVTPLGRPVTLKLTLLLKPFSGVTVMVLVPLAPCRTVTELGLALRLKSGPGTTLITIEFDGMPFAMTERL